MGGWVNGCGGMGGCWEGGWIGVGQCDSGTVWGAGSENDSRGGVIESVHVRGTHRWDPNQAGQVAPALGGQLFFISSF